MADKPSKVVQIGGQTREEDVSLVDILDRVLHAGVMLQGSVVISLAGVDLIYLNLNAVLTSVATALKYANKELPPPSRKALGS
jgi:gas vesicle structural protein